MAVHELSDAAPEKAVEDLEPYDGDPTLCVEWSKAVEACGGVGIGTVREAKDWAALPLNDPVRVVALREGYQWVVRWATPEALEKVAADVTHDGLLHTTDPVDDLCSGYVTRRSKRQIDVMA